MVLAQGLPPTAAQGQVPGGSWLLRFTGFLAAHLAWITGAWVLGALTLTLRLGGGWASTLRWRREALPAPDPWTDRFQALSKAAGAGTRVVLRASRRVTSPVAMGLWRPVVLVPAALFTGMPEPYLEALLAHELAHVARRDFLFNFIQSAIEVLCFHHPVVWWLSRRIRILREHLCDDLAAKTIGEPRRLALALNALDDVQPHLTQLALAARGGILYERIHRLINPGALPGAAPWALAPILALVMPLAAVTLRAASQDPAPIAVSPSTIAELDALAAREGLDPQLLRSIAWTESNFNPNAKSPAGAQGLLQVMPETALKFGAKDLKDPKEVASAGARYLRWLLDRYQGDVAKAVAAYNCGNVAFEAGQIGPETVGYRALVLDVLKAKAVQPEPEPVKGAVLGTWRRRPDNTWTLQANVNASGNWELAVDQDSPGETPRNYARVMVGSTEDTARNWGVSRPMVKAEIPVGTAIRVRCTNPSQGLAGEARMVLDGEWKTFAFTMEAQKK
jgi:beta-lactamase regulating signal transducer with metallopeptidase domain